MATATWEQAKAEILARLDIAREAELLGVRFSAAMPTAGGWRECFAVGREEKKPSAAINVTSQNGTRGYYRDQGSQDGFGFFDLAAKLRPNQFPDWQAAERHYADQVSVKLPTGHRNNGKGAKQSLEEQLRFSNGPATSQMLTQQWISAKKGINESAVRAAGGKLASWPANAPDEKQMNVLAFPGYQPADWSKPTAAVLYRPDGTEFPAGPSGFPPKRKAHLLRNSIDSLMIVGSSKSLAAATTVWLCEGLPDAMCLASHLPADHTALTNSHGAGSFAGDLVTAFKGKRVVIVGDADQAGVAGTKLRAARLLPVAAEVRIVELPFPVAESHGKDLRDFIVEGGTFEQLAALVEAAAVLGPNDVPAPPEARSKADRKKERPEARVRNFSTYVDPTSDKPSTEPLSALDVLEKMRAETGDWPRRVDQSLFVHEGNDVKWLDRPASVFAFIQRMTGIVDWHRGEQYVTKEEFFSSLQQTATKYLAVEEFPHHPPLADHFYSYGEIGSGDGRALEGLLDRFQPATDIDRDLMKAALMTLVWGGGPGTRPAFIFTADRGRGKGKSKTASMMALLVGGSADFSSNDDFETVKKRLLTFKGRVAFLDNVKTLKFSWAELEGLITAPMVSGWRLYTGDGSRPNVFTWFITLNGVALSTDMAQRSVIIKIGDPTNYGMWEEETKSYILTNRRAIIADLVECLKAEGAPLEKYSRWAAWEHGVLSRLPEPAEAQRVILDRQIAVDVEAEEAVVIEEYFASKLRGLGYLTRDRIHIPSETAAQWYITATGDKKKGVIGVGRTIGQLCDEKRTKFLSRNTCNDFGRGLIWQGADASSLSPVCLDLPERIAKRLEAMDRRFEQDR